MTKFRWRVDVAISTSALKRALKPSVLMEMTLSSGKICVFEVSRIVLGSSMGVVRETLSPKKSVCVYVCVYMVWCMYMCVETRKIGLNLTSRK